MRPTAALPIDLRRARQVLRGIRDRDLFPADNNAALGYTFLWDPGPVSAGIEALEKAHALLPLRMDVAYHLAILHLRSDHRDKARALFDLIDRLDPDSDIAAQVSRVRVFEALREIDALMQNGKLDTAHARLLVIEARTMDAVLLEIIDEKLRLIESFQRRSGE